MFYFQITKLINVYSILATNNNNVVKRIIIGINGMVSDTKIHFQYSSEFSNLPYITNKGPDKAEALEVICMFHGIENGWYFAVAISIPLVIWFFVTRRKELKGQEKNKKASDILAD